MSTLEFRGTTVRVGSGRHAMTAVERVDLAVPDGSIMGLVGESGSGKTTLARAAVGLVPVAAGQVLLGGEDVTRARGGAARRRRRIQLVFQDPNSSLDPRMSIAATLSEAIGAQRRLRRGPRGVEVRRLLELVGLDPSCGAQLPRSLSGGQRQRAALARALAAEPEVLIADEITSALDVSVRSAILNVLVKLQRELGLTILFISHDLAVVRYVSDAIAVMHLGGVVERAPADELLTAPRHPYTQALLASVPRLGGSLEAAPGEDVLEGDAPDPYAPPSGCRFHTRCPVGPLVHADRTICARDDPRAGAADRPHAATCHFVGEPATRSPTR